MIANILKIGFVSVLIIILIVISIIPVTNGVMNSEINTNEPKGGNNVFIDWDNLTNPILFFQNRSLKDMTVLYFHDYFYIFTSVRVQAGEPSYNGTIFRTKDFQSYEEFHSENTGGSSTIISIQDKFYIVFQKSVPSWYEKMRRLYYSTSVDLLNWTKPQELMQEIQPYMRHIDGSFAAEDGYIYVGYKGWQTFYVTRSKTKELDGEWVQPVRAWPGGLFQWAENFQFIKIDGTWHMIATARPLYDTVFEYLTGFLRRILHPYVGSHAPFLYSMDGSGACFTDWTRWVNKTYLDVPMEAWNQMMIANSAYLCDWRDYDGFFYLFYSGTNDWWSFEERGHGKIGVVRSKDLVNWDLPGQVKC